MKIENTLNAILGAQILLNYHGFDSQREKTVLQLLNLAEALMTKSRDTELIMNEMARAQIYLLQMQMHYESDEILSLEDRVSAIIEATMEDQDEENEDTI